MVLTENWGCSEMGGPFLVSLTDLVCHQFSDGSNSQKIGRVENGGRQPLRGMIAEDFDRGDDVARGLSIGPRFFCYVRHSN